VGVHIQPVNHATQETEPQAVEPCRAGLLRALAVPCGLELGTLSLATGVAFAIACSPTTSP
jgi:hypothetical protein